MTEMSEAERLEEYRLYKRIPKKEFAAYVGYNTVNSLHAILNGNKKISMKVIRYIASNCPDLNLKWLLIGEGQMLNDSKKNLSKVEKENMKLIKENSELKSQIISLLLKEKNQILEPVS